MAGRGGSGGVGEAFKKIAMWLVGLGFLFALLKIFNGDPFGIVNWLWNSAINIIESIGNWLSGNESFRHIFSKPIPKKNG